MRRPFQQLYSRVAVTFVYLLLLLSGGQVLVFIHFWKRFAAESEQLVHWNPASEIAPELQPALHGRIDHAALEQQLFRLAQLFPHVGVYVLDGDGRVKASFQERSRISRERVSTGPIHGFLSGSTDIELPILGENPLADGEGLSVFSAAPVTLGSAPGYIYAVLEGSRRRMVAEVLQESHAVRSAAFAVLALIAAPKPVLEE